MYCFAINGGSSSLKTAAITLDGHQRLFDLRVDDLRTDQCRLRSEEGEQPLPSDLDAAGAMTAVLAELARRATVHGPPVAFVHRIVHGGNRFRQPVRIDAAVLSALDALVSLAPLHLPGALAAVRTARNDWPDLPHYAVFDTAFHATLPRRAREYALPEELRTRFGLRRYGFHGISHAHVMATVAARLGTTPQTLRIVSCHLGNGASVAAIEYGRSVETSMGMTPLEGLVMGTRAGDLDPGILLMLLRSGEFAGADLDRLLNQRAGLAGLTGTSDLRVIEQRAAGGDEGARLALAVYAHRVRKYIGAYAAVMGGVDVIAFTGGMGEHSALLRHRCLQRLDFLGAELDEDCNRDARAAGEPGITPIHTENSRVRLFVVQADEERGMVLAAAALLAPTPTEVGELRIPVAISARHAHLSQATLQRLFGADYHLQPRTALSQTGQYAAQDTVTLIGPRGRLEQVRLMGPPRAGDQVEISRSDEFDLGVDAPVRISGDLANTPGITVEGPRGRVTLASGLICARRHIHMSSDDARRFGVQDCDTVAVRVDSAGRDLVFEDVSVRVSPQFRLELHLDTDEANAAGVQPGDTATLVRAAAGGAGY
jgi:acetate kinase